MRFEVSINGEVQCCAGISDGEMSVQILSSWSTYVDRERADVRWSDISSAIPGEPAIDVTGLEGESVEQRTFWVWLQEHLKLGDEVTIRILGNGSVTPPKGRKALRSDPRRPAKSAYGSA